MSDELSFGRFLAKRRRYLRLTQEELAKKMGVSKSAIAKWETDGGLPDRDNLKRLAEVINVLVDDLHKVIAKVDITDADQTVNITSDVIASLESYGYKVIPPEKDPQ